MQYSKNNNEIINFTTILEDSKNATIFKHFKGHTYKIITMSKDSEDLSDVVIYQNINDKKSIWNRKAEDFFSKVDKEKYPDIKQEYRFEIIK